MSRLRFSSALVLVPGVLGTGCLDLVNANVLGDATMGGETTSSTTSGETTSSTTTSSTTSGETTSSTTTPTTGCNHDAPEPCYEGPPLTEGIGACHAGEHACLEDGSSSVQCYGQVLPSVECGLDGIDKDCNGRAVAHEWSRAVGGPDIQRIYGSAVLPDGSAVFTGYTWGSMNVGDYTLEGGAFAFKTDGAGAVTWAKSFGQLKAAVGLSVAVDPQGDVLLTGFSSTPIDFGGGVFSPPQQVDLVAKLSGATGDHLWSHFIGGGVDLTVNSVVAVDFAGNAVIAGQYDGTLAWPDGEVVVNPTAERHLFLSFLDPSGKHVQSRDYGPSAIPTQIRVDMNGDILLLGATTGAASLGEGASLGANRNFLARFSPDGTLLWKRAIGESTVAAFGRGFDVRWDGTVVVAVPFNGLLNLGVVPVEVTSLDIAVVAFTPQGDVVWSKVFGGEGEDSPWGMAITGDGDIVIGGTFEQTIDVGLCPAQAAVKHDAFLLDLDAAGEPMWIRAFGDTSGDVGDFGAAEWPSEIVTTVGAAADGSIVISGEMDGIVSWGGDAFAAEAPGDLVVARYSR